MNRIYKLWISTDRPQLGEQEAFGHRRCVADAGGSEGALDARRRGAKRCDPAVVVVAGAAMLRATVQHRASHIIVESARFLHGLCMQSFHPPYYSCTAVV